MMYFQYGLGGYQNASLFRIDIAFIRKYNLMGLIKTAEKSRMNHPGSRRMSE